jgi:hypothetical protein
MHWHQTLPLLHRPHSPRCVAIGQSFIVRCMKPVHEIRKVSTSKASKNSKYHRGPEFASSSFPSCHSTYASSEYIGSSEAVQEAPAAALGRSLSLSQEAANALLRWQDGGKKDTKMACPGSDSKGPSTRSFNMCCTYDQTCGRWCEASTVLQNN